MHFFAHYAEELQLKKIIALENFLTGTKDWLTNLVESDPELIKLHEFNVITDSIEDVPWKRIKGEAAVTTAGTARPSAQGQVMMSVAAEMLMAKRMSPPVFHIHQAKALKDSVCTSGE